MKDAPLLYHLLVKLLADEQRVYAYFTEARADGRLVTGTIQYVKLNAYGHPVIYTLINGAHVQMQALFDEDLDNLLLCKIGANLWQLENAPPSQSELEPEL